MADKNQNENKTFIDLLREEIKGCVKEAISSFIPAQPATESLPLTLTVAQFCKHMNISRTVAYDMINSAGFPAFRVGTKYLINTRGLQGWINQQSNWRDDS